MKTPCRETGRQLSGSCRKRRMWSLPWNPTPATCLARGPCKDALDIPRTESFDTTVATAERQPNSHPLPLTEKPWLYSSVMWSSMLWGWGRGGRVLILSRIQLQPLQLWSWGLRGMWTEAGGKVSTRASSGLWREPHQRGRFTFCSWILLPAQGTQNTAATSHMACESRPYVEAQGVESERIYVWRCH